MATVNCTGCGAELSDDRKLCPHCQTAVVRAVDVAFQNAADDKERGYIQQIVKLDQTITLLTEDNKRLVQKCNELTEANLHLLKQVAPATLPDVEKTGPGVVAESNDAAVAESLAAAGPTPVHEMKTL